jgi:hypothetical protein
MLLQPCWAIRHGFLPHFRPREALLSSVCVRSAVRMAIFLDLHRERKFEIWVAKHLGAALALGLNTRILPVHKLLRLWLDRTPTLRRTPSLPSNRPMGTAPCSRLAPLHCGGRGWRWGGRRQSIPGDADPGPQGSRGTTTFWVASRPEEDLDRCLKRVVDTTDAAHAEVRGPHRERRTPAKAEYDPCS